MLNWVKYGWVSLWVLINQCTRNSSWLQLLIIICMVCVSTYHDIVTNAIFLHILLQVSIIYGRFFIFDLKYMYFLNFRSPTFTCLKFERRTDFITQVFFGNYSVLISMEVHCTSSTGLGRQWHATVNVHLRTINTRVSPATLRAISHYVTLCYSWPIDAMH